MVVRLKTHMFNIGSAKYSAQYKLSVDRIACHVQQEYRSGSEIAKAMRNYFPLS